MGLLLVVLILLVLFGVIGGVALSPLFWLLLFVAFIVWLFGHSRV